MEHGRQGGRKNRRAGTCCSLFLVFSSNTPQLLVFFWGAQVAGGLKKREQRFNRRAAGVSGVLLFLSIMGAFTPTVYYIIYGQHSLDCAECTHIPSSNNTSLACHGCSYVERDLNTDPVFQNKARSAARFTASPSPPFP